MKAIGDNCIPYAGIRRQLTRSALRFAMASLLTVMFTGPYQPAAARDLAASVKQFYVITHAEYVAWHRSHFPAPGAVTTFNGFQTPAVGFYLSYNGAVPSVTTAQVVVYDTYFSSRPWIYGRSQVIKLLYADGVWVSSVIPSTLARVGYIVGPYRAVLFVNGFAAASANFTVRLPSVAPSRTNCTARNVEGVVSCDEASVLRIQGDTLDGKYLSTGTGFVIRSDGTGTYVVTNKHVIASDRLSTIRAVSPDGRTVYHALAARITAASEGTGGDLAVIKLPTTTLRPLSWGSSDGLKVGQTLVSIGYALNIPGEPTVTTGIVSALHRDLGDGFGSAWIQHQSAINHGNSGGPLLTLSGQVVGVNTITPKDSQGIFFAIASKGASGIVQRLVLGIR